MNLIISIVLISVGLALANAAQEDVKKEPSAQERNLEWYRKSGKWYYKRPSSPHYKRPSSPHSQKSPKSPNYNSYKKKSKKKYSYKKYDHLEASIESIDSEYDLLDGWVDVEMKYGKLKVDFHIDDAPENCDDCVMAIYDGHRCRRSSLGRPYHDRYSNPWKDKAVYVTNKHGRSAGFFEIDTGYDMYKNSCKLVVLFDGDGRRGLTDAIGCGVLIPENEDSDYCD